jgi:acyl-coenzyme A thioesterase 9
VTAAVDAIHLSKRLKIDTDVTMSGQVVWTGSSSMDIRMELLQVTPTLIQLLG